MAPIRKKVAKKTNSRAEPENTPTIAGQPILSHERNDFLRQARTSKKDKRETKKTEFREKLTTSGAKISKSGARRQKRKAASSLKGNLSDLLSSLPVTEEGQEPGSDNGYIAVKRKQIDPKKSSKSRERVLREEVTRFNRVLGEESFKKAPFETLRSFITSNLEQKDTFIEKQKKKAAKASSSMPVD